ncbi:MAG: lamin tail domain-containing protein [Verrucomicrobiales bacterium]
MVAAIHTNYETGAELAALEQDSDSDGMPDFWEIQFGLNPNSAADAALDPDRDGAANLDEYARGTTPLSPPTYELVEIEIPGGGSVYPAALSEAGHVGGSYYQSGVSLPFVWSQDGGFIAIPLPEGARSGNIASINSSGVATGSYIDDLGRTKAMLWDGAALHLPMAASAYSYGYSVNAAGQAAGYYAESYSSRRAFTAAGDASSGIAALDAANPYPYAISDSGAIFGHGTISGRSGTSAFFYLPGSGAPGFLVPSSLAPTYSYWRATSPTGITAGTYRSGSTNYGFRWTPNGSSGSTEALFTLGGTYASPSAVAADGAVAGSSSTPDYKTYATLWRPGQGNAPVNLGDLGGGYSYANAVAASDGAHEVFGSSADESGRYHPFVWKFGEMRPLKDCTAKPGDWSITYVRSANSAGMVLAQGYHHSQSRACLLVPVPDGDGDGCPDAFEVACGLNPLDGADGGLDRDGDTLTNAQEFTAMTSPDRRDTDGDLIPDDWEFANYLNPADPGDAGNDYDGDRLTNLQEYRIGSNPLGNYEIEAATGVQGDYVYVSGMSDSGHVAGTLYDYSDGYAAFGWKWDAVTNQRVDLVGTNPGGYLTVAGVSGDGTVAGTGTNLFGVSQIAIWPPSVGESTAQFYDFGFSYPSVVGVSEGGNAAANLYNTNFSHGEAHPFHVSDPLLTKLLIYPSPGYSVWAYAVNDSGDSLLCQNGFNPQTDTYEYLYSVLPNNGQLGGGETLLAYPGGTDTYGYRMNSAGDVLGTYYGDSSGSFIYRAATGSYEDATPELYGAPGYYWDVDFNERGEILRAGSEGGLLTRSGFTAPIARFASPGSGWALGDPAALNSAGYIAGQGSYNGQNTFYRIKAADDLDGNGLPDDWERFHFGATLGSSIYSDHDGDQLSANAEFALGTDPFSADSDGDGMSDGYENQTRAIGNDPLASALQVPPKTLVITELMASNSSTVRDGFAKYSDWIEIHNPTKSAINLAGWVVADSGNSKILPDLSVAPGEYFLIFASDQNAVLEEIGEQRQIHVPFKLSASGEQLTLTDPTGAVVSALRPKFPSLETDESYGLSPDFSRWGFCQYPTPGEPNSPVSDGLVGQPIIASVAGGYFEDPISVQLSYFPPAQYLLYTLDGSDPKPGNAQARLLNPGDLVFIETTTVLTAQSFRDGEALGAPSRWTYLFLGDVPKQVRPIDGVYPEVGAHSKMHWSYGFDLGGISDGGVGCARQPSLDQPLALDPAELFGASGRSMQFGQGRSRTSGLAACSSSRSNSGVGAPPENATWSVPCGVEIAGDSSRSPGITPKHGFDLSFKRRYGATKWTTDLFGDSNEEYQRLVLRPAGADK